MPERENATAGKPAAGQNEHGQDAQSHYTTIGNGNQPFGANNAGHDAVLAEIDALVEQAIVEPADVLTVGKVQRLLDQVSDYTGNARQAALEALRALVGHLAADERQQLNFFRLFEPPDQPKQIECFLASCLAPSGAPVFQPKSLADLRTLPRKQWLVDQVLGAGDIGMIFGPPGSGKSFIVIDMIFAACRGVQWAMRFKTARLLSVAYCAGEGLGGLPQRFAAAAQHHDIVDLPNFTFFDSAPQLFTPERGGSTATAETIGRFVREWQQRQKDGTAGALDVLIIDTLHSATAGADENSAQDMGQVLMAVKSARRVLGCAVVLVHHSNKAGTGERGSSAMRGAMDFMIEVKLKAGKFAVECAKLKDAPAWKPQTFDLIALGDSARVRWDEPGEMDGKAGKQAKDAEAILAVLRGHPGTRYTATELAKAIGMGGSKQIFKLIPKAIQDNASVRSGLKDANDLLQAGLLGGFLAAMRANHAKSQDEREGLLWALYDAARLLVGIDTGSAKILRRLAIQLGKQAAIYELEPVWGTSGNV